MAALLELLSWNEGLLLRYTTVCSSVTRVGFSLVGYDGGGVGDPLFLEFVVLRKLSCCDNWLSVNVQSLICCCKLSVTPMTLDLRGFSVAPFIPLFKRSKGILDAAQIRSKRTKTRRVVIPWFLISQYALVMMPRKLEMMTSITNMDTMYIYILPSLAKAGDILAPTRLVSFFLKLRDGNGSSVAPLAMYPWLMFLVVSSASRTFL